MTGKKIVLSPQLKALKKTDLSPMIRMSNLMAPRMLGVFLPKLNDKQRKAFNKVMPLGAGKKIYIHLLGTPTPPIVIEMAQPLKMTMMTENEVKQQRIKGLRLGVEDLQAAMERRFGDLFWRLKGQIGVILSMSGNFMPIILLGPRELKDMQKKATTHFKPLIDMVPRY